MKDNVEYLPNCGQVLAELLKDFHAGKIKGLVVGVLDSEDYCQSCWSGLTYLQRLGLAESLKLAIERNAR